MRVQLIVRKEAGDDAFTTAPAAGVEVEIPGEWVVCMAGDQAFAIVAPDVLIVKREEKP